MASISSTNAYRADDPYEQLIASMISIERQPQNTLKAERAEQARMKGVIGDLDSKISALNKLVSTFTDLFTSPFQARAATGGSSSHFSVSAGDKAAYGAHTVQVERLAATDTRISAQLGRAGSTLAGFFTANGDAPQTISIGVGTPTADDPHARTDIAVTIDPADFTDASDDGILKHISSAINAAMDAAVDDGTLTTGQKAAASVVNESSSTTRLSLRSGATGFSNRLTFTDSGNGLLDALDLLDTADPEKLATGTAGGQVKRVGTDEMDSDLTARFKLDGLTLYRNTNSVTDALEGVTLSLNGVGDAEQDFTVEPGADAIKKELDDFIKKYNDVLGYIENKSRIDGDSGTRGDFASDSTVRGLRFGMRNDLVRAVAGQGADAPKSITDLGIEIGKDGTLTLKDPDVLIAAVKKDAAGVQSLFSGDDGLAKRLETRLGQFTGATGLITARKKSYDDRLTRIDNRIKDWDERLTQREDQLRAQFAQMQQTIALLQGQQSAFQSYLYY